MPVLYLMTEGLPWMVSVPRGAQFDQPEVVLKTASYSRLSTPRANTWISLPSAATAGPSWSSPAGVGDHRVGHGGDAVPAGEPDVVGPGLERGGVVDADQVADPGAGARVGARQVAQLVQPCRPAAQEGEHR